MTYDTVVGGIEKVTSRKNVFAARGQCVLIAWLAAGSSTTCASMELARCGSSANVCVYGATIFPVCLAFQGRKNLFDFEFMFILKEKSNETKGKFDSHRIF